MKVIITCLIIIVSCSCCQTTDDIHQGIAKSTMTRHDEIRKIMRDHWIHQYETGDFYWLSTNQRKKELHELRKMKKDYYYKPNDPNIILDIPGPEWYIRGPLTIEQVEQESLEKIKKSSRNDVPQVPFGFQNDKWIKFKSQYKDGDELYFFGSELTRGYVLIHKNNVVDTIVTDVS